MLCAHSVLHACSDSLAMIARERQALNSTANALSREDPHLVSLLLMFSRLNAGEDMPSRERVHWHELWRTRSSRLPRRRCAAGLGRRRGAGPVRSHLAGTVLVGWMFIVVALACVLIALAGVSEGSGSGQCRATPLAGCVPSQHPRSASPTASADG